MKKDEKNIIKIYIIKKLQFNGKNINNQQILILFIIIESFQKKEAKGNSFTPNKSSFKIRYIY